MLDVLDYTKQNFYRNFLYYRISLVNFCVQVASDILYLTQKAVSKKKSHYAIFMLYKYFIFKDLKLKVIILLCSTFSNLCIFDNILWFIENAVFSLDVWPDTSEALHTARAVDKKHLII